MSFKIALFVLSVICLTTFPVVVKSSYAVDISSSASQYITSSELSCLAQNNQKLIIQGWDGGRGLNPHLANVYNMATSAGFTQIDVYAFFCSQCSGNNPVSTAVKQLVSYCQSNGVNIGTLWVDVEQCTGCWGSLSSNTAFVTQAVQSATEMGVSVGIYTSIGEWPLVVGSLSSLSSYPLWYAHYDGNPSFSDPKFFQFGGWQAPVMKQYDENKTQCGVYVDLDYFEDGSTGSSSSTSGNSSGNTSGNTSGNSSGSSSSSSSGSSGGSSTGSSGSGSSGGSGQAI